MTRRAVRRGKSTIDPMFHIPEDVDELVYEDKTLDPSYDSEDDIGYEVSVEFVDGEYTEDDSDDSDVPDTPQILGIVPPQVVRMGDGGTEVVDVIFEVEDFYNIDNYEFRVTKI